VLSLLIVLSLLMVLSFLLVLLLYVALLHFLYLWLFYFWHTLQKQVTNFAVFAQLLNVSQFLAFDPQLPTILANLKELFPLVHPG